MAAKKRKKKKKLIRFELSIAGFSGLAVVCFCVFLWMFLFGVWAGQTILLPSSGEVVKDKLSHASGKNGRSGTNMFDRHEPSLGVSVPKVARSITQKKGAQYSSDDVKSSFFSLQVDSIDDMAQAREAVLRWQARGHDAFLLEPAAERESYWRIFVGRFVNLTDANSQAALLEKEEGVKVYITLLPADHFPVS